MTPDTTPVISPVRSDDDDPESGEEPPLATDDTVTVVLASSSDGGQWTGGGSVDVAKESIASRLVPGGIDIVELDVGPGWGVSVAVVRHAVVVAVTVTVMVWLSPSWYPFSSARISG